jgi:hypothetical protein
MKSSDKWLWIGGGILVWIMWRRIYSAGQWLGGAAEGAVGGISDAFGWLAGWFYPGEIMVNAVLAEWYLRWLQHEGEVGEDPDIIPPEYAGQYQAWQQDIFDSTVLSSGDQLSKGQVQDVWNDLNTENGVSLPLPQEWS